MAHVGGGRRKVVAHIGGQQAEQAAIGPPSLAGVAVPSCSVKVDGSARSVTVSAADMPLLSMLHDVLKLTRNKNGCGIEVRKARTVMANGLQEKRWVVDISWSPASGWSPSRGCRMVSV